MERGGGEGNTILALHPLPEEKRWEHYEEGHWVANKDQGICLTDINIS